MSDTPWTGIVGDILYLQSGDFTSTVKKSEDISGIDTAPEGIEWNGTDTPWCGSEADKLYLQSGQFTSTVSDSEAVTTIDDRPRDISWDGTNTPWCGSGADKFYLQSGQFTGTLKDSIDPSETTRGISFDGTDTPWCRVAAKLFRNSGQFTTTILDSLDTTSWDTGPHGISWNGADTLWCGSVGDILFRFSGSFTSTLHDSEDVSGTEGSLSGIGTNDVFNRLGIGGTEYPKSETSTLSLSQIIGLETILDRTITSTLVFSQDFLRTIEDSAESTIIFDQSVDEEAVFSRTIVSTLVFSQDFLRTIEDSVESTLVFGDDIDNIRPVEDSAESTLALDHDIDASSSIFNRTPSDTLVLDHGVYPTHESELIDSLVFSQLVSAETALTECSGKRHWPRWIFASAAKHFDSNISLPFFIEGTQRLTDDEQKHVEFRIEGPDVIELSHNYYRLDVVINVLWSFNQDNEDFHETERIKGILINSMCDICIYRYGSGAFDDDSLLGILELSQGVKVNNFGQVRQDVRLLQGSVEGTYRMYLNCN